jgi:hypothetical protein
MHRDIARTLDFPDYYGRNLDALNDCLGDVACGAYGVRPNVTGLVLVLQSYDQFAARSADTAHELLGIFATQARRGPTRQPHEICLSNPVTPGWPWDLRERHQSSGTTRSFSTPIGVLSPVDLFWHIATTDRTIGCCCVQRPDHGPGDSFVTGRHSAARDFRAWRAAGGADVGRAGRYQQKQQVECGLRVVDGAQLGLGTRFRHGLATLEPGAICFVPCLGGVRFLHGNPVRVPVVAADRSDQRSVGWMELSSASPGCRVIKVLTGVATRECVLPSERAAWAAEQIRPQ